MIGIETIVSIIMTLLIAGCIIGLLFWLIHVVPVPSPYKGWILVVLQVLIILFLIGMLLGFLTGRPLIRWQRADVVYPTQGVFL